MTRRHGSQIALALLLAPFAGVVGYNMATDATSAKAEVPARPETPGAVSTRSKVALDCNRPQGHHRWIGDVIVPQDGTVMRVSTGDMHEDIDIEGWLCVIDAEPER